MNYTSIEQSEKLLELGLNPKSADMYFMNICPEDGKTLFDDVAGVGNADISNNDLPCWSVGALLEVMPKQLPDYMLYEKNFWYDNFENKWNAAYIYYKVYDSESGEVYPSVYDGKTFTADNLINACYNMIVWLLESGKLQKHVEKEK